jgi:hypothetical protein
MSVPEIVAIAIAIVIGVVVLVVIASFLPSLMRYIRISRM